MRETIPYASPFPPGSRGLSVLVLVHETQRDHAMLRALRQRAQCANVRLEECELSESGRIGLADVGAVTAIGPYRSRAAKFAIDNELIHLVLGDGHDVGSLDAVFGTRPEYLPVIAVAVNETNVDYGLDRVHIEGPRQFTVGVDGHRWPGIAGPITFEISSRRNGAVWMSMRDGPAIVLSASPALTASVAITADAETLLIVDEHRRRFPHPTNLAVSLPLRHRTVHIAP
jgi:hypothetical protein